MSTARPALLALAAAVGLLLAGCGDDPAAAPAADAPPASTSSTAALPSPTAPTTESQAPAPATGTVVATGDSEFGPMLFDGNGQAIYLFDQETTGAPECYGECATAWPPVLTDGAPRADGATDPALLGTTPRSDGSTQVTYAGHPLYTYANEDPGQVLCHDVFLNGGTWFVVTPQGAPGPV